MREMFSKDYGGKFNFFSNTISKFLLRMSFFLGYEFTVSTLQEEIWKKFALIPAHSTTVLQALPVKPSTSMETTVYVYSSTLSPWKIPRNGLVSVRL